MTRGVTLDLDLTWKAELTFPFGNRGDRLCESDGEVEFNYRASPVVYLNADRDTFSIHGQSIPRAREILLSEYVKLLSASKLGQIKVDRDDARRVRRCGDWNALAFRSDYSNGASYRTDNGLFSGIAANCFRACGLSLLFFSFFFFTRDCVRRSVRRVR